MSLLRRLLPLPSRRRRRAAPPPPSPRPRLDLGRYTLRDAGLAHLTEADLYPELRAALAIGRPAATARPLLPGLYAVRILSAAWCARLLAELDAVDAWCRAHGVEPARPNSMNRYGLWLAHLGLDPAMEALRARWLSPLAAALFPEVGGAGLDGHHAFIVDYSPGGDLDLGLHVDDSEVTLNLCLGGDFEGGELFVEGRRCVAHMQEASHPEERLALAHAPGVALLHAGKLRHGALPVRAGRRRNLVLWARSSPARAEEEALAEAGDCPAWCGHRAAASALTTKT